MFYKQILRMGGKLFLGNHPNITSQLGSITLQKGEFSGIGSVDYNASKAALNMISTILASQLKAQGVIIIIQSPGWASTDMGGNEGAIRLARKPVLNTGV